MVQTLISEQRRFFNSGQTRAYQFRMNQLKKMSKMLKENEVELLSALQKDLNKPEHEALATEIGPLQTEISFIMKNLKEWMEPKKVANQLMTVGSENVIYYEPYGVTLNISPWNYPVLLALSPALGAIAAGNTVILKPSELAPNVSKVITNMIANTFEAELFTVIEGDKTISDQLLDERFDYIFFTGSPQIGKIVMEKASKYLTPVTLELGGKSPAIVDKDCKLKLTAKRIAWGKLTNSGQTCVAPDYLYVHEAIIDKFIKQLIKQIEKLYGKNPLKNDLYGKIINEGHYERLLQLIDEDKVIYGGSQADDTLKISPTIMTGVTWEDAVMREEIFGPIIPIMTYRSLDKVIGAIRQYEKPLALYYFGNNKANEERVMNELSFGGGCVNDTLFHLVNTNLPFGGVGTSGMGAYHGEFSFETFSHRKGVLKQTTKFDFPMRYPGGKLNTKLMKQVMK